MPDQIVSAAEHHLYTRAKWREEVYENETLLGYREWVDMMVSVDETKELAQRLSALNPLPNQPKIISTDKRSIDECLASMIIFSRSTF